ncbi:MAG: alpha/beta hydrolase [Actinomycetia bacterium]|nr:alpha/beta hydrolase [Actinomycetes bacterium]MCP5033141.1 alpha/beta hydrolase [Actinomycetes bacterium]
MTEPLRLEDHLDDDHRAVLAALPTDLLDLSDIEVARARLAALFDMLPTPELPATVEISEVEADGIDGGPAVRLKLYQPSGRDPSAPALLWIHGGGMVLGNADQDDANCATMANDLGAVVVSVDYRLAPEHPYPAPLDDCYAGLLWLAGATQDLGVDPNRIGIGGASAGGGLAAGLALRARDSGGPAICYQHLIFPMLDDRNETPSSKVITDSRVWNREANRSGWDAYLGPLSGDEVPIYAAPGRASNLSGLPRAYLPVGSLDLFLDEDLSYGQRLLQAGVPTEIRVFPGAFHGSSTFVPGSEISLRWARDAGDALRRGLGVS